MSFLTRRCSYLEALILTDKIKHEKGYFQPYEMVQFERVCLNTKVVLIFNTEMQVHTQRTQSTQLHLLKFRWKLESQDEQIRRYLTTVEPWRRHLGGNIDVYLLLNIK